MNIQSLVLVAPLASVLTATMVWPQTLIHLNHNNNNYSTPEQVSLSTISLDAAALQQPHILAVSISSGYIDGEIELNGRVLSHLQDRDTRIDLSPRLLRGRNIIKISGNYHPELAAVTVELAGPQTQIMNQTAGNGRLNQIIILQVQ